MNATFNTRSLGFHRVSIVGTTARMERIKILRKSSTILKELLDHEENQERMEALIIGIDKINKELSELTASGTHAIVSSQG